MMSMEEFDPEEFIQQAQANLSSFLPSTAVQLVSPLFDDETQARLAYIAQTPVDDVYT
jgi:hypothetical protein